ncbi:hypothetical protein H5410_055722 [Solanum commersonii]|uniref:Uncharacterized protein n=1 Tax=Solanum commersonii TaxID=4109 RepID=A0A9J5WK68_SOLCO|nr:hypothetical protein H5410_055722 [Solanum commersonii]
MDSAINTFVSSEMIPTSSVAINLSASVATESPMEVIAHLDELNHGDHFTTFQQTQSASLTHSTQDTSLVYTFSSPKAPMVTHHDPPVYTYVIAPPVTKA